MTTKWLSVLLELSRNVHIAIKKQTNHKIIHSFDFIDSLFVDHDWMKWVNMYQFISWLQWIFSNNSCNKMIIAHTKINNNIHSAEIECDCRIGHCHRDGTHSHTHTHTLKNRNIKSPAYVFPCTVYSVHKTVEWQLAMSCGWSARDRIAREKSHAFHLKSQKKKKYMYAL